MLSSSLYDARRPTPEVWIRNIHDVCSPDDTAKLNAAAPGIHLDLIHVRSVCNRLIQPNHSYLHRLRELSREDAVLLESSRVGAGGDGGGDDVLRMRYNYDWFGRPDRLYGWLHQRLGQRTDPSDTISWEFEDSDAKSTIACSHHPKHARPKREEHHSGYMTCGHA